jgi:hypothetical protein
MKPYLHVTGVFTSCFCMLRLRVLDIYRLKFGICAVPDTIAYCDVQYWLLRGVLAAKLVDWHSSCNITCKNLTWDLCH